MKFWNQSGFSFVLRLTKMNINLKTVGLTLFCFAFLCQNFLQASIIKKVDICIYGGTSAGVIAAYSAKNLGKSVILIEPGKHIGGMITGGLSATDIGNKIAITGLSRDFFRRLGKHYGKFEHWLPEPKVAEKIFQDYLKEAGAEVVYQKRIATIVTGIL